MWKCWLQNGSNFVSASMCNRQQAIIWACDDFTDTCVSPLACDQSGIATLPRLCECTTYLWSGRLPSGRLITCKRIEIFSCDQAALWMILSIFSSHTPLIRSNWHWQRQCPCKRSRSEVKVAEVKSNFALNWASPDRNSSLNCSHFTKIFPLGVSSSNTAN